MKSRTLSIIVAVTITLTLFVAIAVCVLNPFNGSNNNLPSLRDEKEEFSTPPEPEMRPEGKMDSSVEDGEVELLLSDSEFQSALREALEKKLGDDKVADSLSKSIIETDAFKKQVSSYLASEEAESSSSTDVDSNSISLPHFDDNGLSLSDEEYAARHEESRTSEIEKVLKYMGY